MMNEGIKTFTANGALAAKTRVKLTSESATTPPQVATAGLAEQHIGITEYAAADGALVAVRLRNYPGTHECVAADTFAVGAVLYGAALGKLTDSSSSAGTAIGIALEECTGAGDIVEFIDFTVISTTAATISVVDSNSNMTGSTVEAVLDEIMKGIKTAQYMILPSDIRLETGAVIPAFANASADGWAQMSSKSMAIRWNNGSTPTDMVAQFVLPNDFKDDSNVILHLMGAIIKAGELVDSPKVTVEAYFDEIGAAPGADTDCGGDSSEFTADGVFEEATLTITAANAPAVPTVLTIVFHPKDGELGTDDFVLLIPWLEVTRKCLTT